MWCSFAPLRPINEYSFLTHSDVVASPTTFFLLMEKGGKIFDGERSGARSDGKEGVKEGERERERGDGVTHIL